MHEATSVGGICCSEGWSFLLLLFSPRAVYFAVVWGCRQLSLSIKSVGTKVPPHPRAGFTFPRPPARSLLCVCPRCCGVPAGVHRLRLAGERTCSAAHTRRCWRGVPAPPSTFPSAPTAPWVCVLLCFPSVCPLPSVTSVRTRARVPARGS